MTEPLSAAELNEATRYLLEDASVIAAEHIARLLAEVERLRGELDAASKQPVSHDGCPICGPITQGDR